MDGIATVQVARSYPWFWRVIQTGVVHEASGGGWLSFSALGPSILYLAVVFSQFQHLIMKTDFTSTLLRSERFEPYACEQRRFQLKMQIKGNLSRIWIADEGNAKNRSHEWLLIQLLSKTVECDNDQPFYIPNSDVHKEIDHVALWSSCSHLDTWTTVF